MWFRFKKSVQEIIADRYGIGLIEGGSVFYLKYLLKDIEDSYTDSQWNYVKKEVEEKYFKNNWTWDKKSEFFKLELTC